MATATPKKSVTAVAATINSQILTLTFANGEVLTLNADALDPAIYAAAVMHGLKQKLIDAAAISRDPETGRTATIDDKYAAVRTVFDRITRAENPSWNIIRGTGEGGGNKGGLLVRAMMRLTGKSRDEIMTFLEDKTKEEVAALRKNPRIEEIMSQLRAESANTSGIDSDSLLDGLMGDSGDSGEE